VTPGHTPRIAPVTEPDEDQRARLAKTPVGPDGRPLNLFATLAHRPRLMARVNALGGCLALENALSSRRRELVILRAAANACCAYEIAHHRVLGERAGLSPAEIESILDRSSTQIWSAADRALLLVVDELADSADVSDDTWSGLDGVLEQDERIDLLMLAGFYRMIGGFLNAARVERDR
jgi:4-carboxymuconolactone decarboxylase